MLGFVSGLCVLLVVVGGASEYLSPICFYYDDVYTVTTSIKQPIFGFCVCWGCYLVLVLSVGAYSLYLLRRGRYILIRLCFGMGLVPEGGRGKGAHAAD